MPENNKLRYNEIVGKYITGDGYAAFLLSCIDFMYYVQLMHSMAALEDAQLVWQHARDLARYSSEQKNCEDATKFIKAMDEMLEKKDQQSLTKAFDIVRVAIGKNVEVSDAVQTEYDANLMQIFAAFDKSVGIPCDQYFLFRAITQNKKGKGAYKKHRFLFDVAIVVFTILVIYAIAKFF